MNESHIWVQKLSFKSTYYLNHYNFEAIAEKNDIVQLTVENRTLMLKLQHYPEDEVKVKDRQGKETTDSFLCVLEDLSGQQDYTSPETYVQGSMQPVQLS